MNFSRTFVILKIFHCCRDIQDKTGRDAQQGVNLRTLLKELRGQSDVAICFYKLLDLATIGAVRVSQNRPFGDITIWKQHGILG